MNFFLSFWLNFHIYFFTSYSTFLACDIFVGYDTAWCDRLSALRRWTEGGSSDLQNGCRGRFIKKRRYMRRKTWKHWICNEYFCPLHLFFSILFVFWIFLKDWEESYTSIGESPGVGGGSLSADRQVKGAEQWYFVYFAYFVYFIMFWINNNFKK